MSVYNPARLIGKTPTRSECMRRDIHVLTECDIYGKPTTQAVVFLDGWAESEGACVERSIAEAFDIHCYSQAEVESGLL